MSTRDRNLVLLLIHIRFWSSPRDSPQFDYLIRPTTKKKLYDTIRICMTIIWQHNDHIYQQHNHILTVARQSHESSGAYLCWQEKKESCHVTAVQKWKSSSLFYLGIYAGYFVKINIFIWISSSSSQQLKLKTILFKRWSGYIGTTGS